MSVLGQVVHKLPHSMQQAIERHRHALLVLRGLNGVVPRACPLCDYQGRFRAFGLPPQFDAECPKCGSLPRHRLFALLDREHGFLRGIRSLLHFAPEPILRVRFESRIDHYRTADIARMGVDFCCNIEGTGLPAESFEAIFASHILEHVDDRKALCELYRVLKPGGSLIAMVPMVEGWDVTYEDSSICASAERRVHFGQDDHVRWYGRDFSERLARAGFEVTAYTATPADCVRHGLSRGEKVFVARKPEQAVAQGAAE